MSFEARLMDVIAASSHFVVWPLGRAIPQEAVYMPPTKVGELPYLQLQDGTPVHFDADQTVFVDPLGNGEILDHTGKMCKVGFRYSAPMSIAGMELARKAFLPRYD
jgi:hypothetical protein